MKNNLSTIIVIMATFNRRERLHKAINSVIEQTCQTWKLIIVDDGSSDGTKQYLESLSDSRILTYSLKQNSGVNKARNKAIDIVQENNLEGFITLLDDDDTFHARCFEEIINIISQGHTLDRHWYTANCVRTDGSKISRIKNYGPSSYIYDYMYGNKIKGDVTHFISTHIIKDIRFSTHFKNSEEWFFFSQLAKENQLCTINYDAKIVETLPTGLLSSKVNKDKKIEVLKYKLEMFKSFLPEKYTSLQIISLANELAKTSRKEEARALLKTLSFRNRMRYKYLLAYLRCYY